MSENNNYENFNQYSEPAQPINIDANGSGADSSYVMMLDDSAEQSHKATTQGVWSIVVGIFSCCCCCFFPITALVGLGLAISGLKKDKHNGASIAGLIINIIGVAILAYLIIGIASQPEVFQQAYEQAQQAMEQNPQSMEEYQEMLEQAMEQAQAQAGMIGRLF